MCHSFRLCLQSCVHDLLNLLSRVSRLPSSTSGDFPKSNHTLLYKAVSPKCDTLPVQLQLISDAWIRIALRREQDDTRPLHNLLRSMRYGEASVELFSNGFDQFRYERWTRHGVIIARPENKSNYTLH